MTTTLAPDGTSIHYEELGAGEPVLLVHGLTESGLAWGTVPERLATSRRVVVLDLPGHGQSAFGPSYELPAMVAAAASVITDAGLERPRLVGHSMGGVVVSALAPAVPVRSVVNVDQPLKLDDFQALLQSVAAQLRDPDTFPGVMHAILDGLAGDALPPAELDRIHAVRRLDQEVVLGVWAVVLDTPAEDLAALVADTARAIAVPYLSLHGSDPGASYAEWLTGLVPDAIVEIWPDVGHYPHLVEPDRFVHRLEAFWSGD